MRGLLEVRDLTLQFPDGSAGLDGATLSVWPGELLALTGASGAGKTLLSRAVLHLLPPNVRISGRILLDGTPMAGEGPDLRRLALIPQSVTFLDPLATVGQQIRWAARRAGLKPTRELIARSLTDVALAPPVDKQYPGMLSAGMTRRIMLAIALVKQPDIILADEPTDGLDAHNLDIVVTRLRALADAGKTVVVITHDLPAILPFADRVAVMQRGRVVAEECASAFSGKGEDLVSTISRRLWEALPQNEFGAKEAHPDA